MFGFSKNSEKLEALIKEKQIFEWKNLFYWCFVLISA
jgi:hypothetical protein